MISPSLRLVRPRVSRNRRWPRASVPISDGEQAQPDDDAAETDDDTDDLPPPVEF
jgi:hypothetical protein